jgi:hypothetical protein
MPETPDAANAIEVPLSLSLADMHASQGDLGEALAWLELYAERESLPAAYKRKRARWAREARTDPQSTRPRSRRRTATVGPVHD